MDRYVVTYKEFGDTEYSYFWADDGHHALEQAEDELKDEYGIEILRATKLPSEKRIDLSTDNYNLTIEIKHANGCINSDLLGDENWLGEYEVDLINRNFDQEDIKDLLKKEEKKEIELKSVHNLLLTLAMEGVEIESDTFKRGIDNALMNIINS